MLSMNVFLLLTSLFQINVISLSENVFGGCDNLETLSSPFIGKSREATTASNNILSYWFYTSEHGSSYYNNYYGTVYDYTYRYYILDGVFETLSRGSEYRIYQLLP